MLLATARKVSPALLANSISVLKGWGLEVQEAPHLYASHEQFAGTDAQRLQDLQEALNNPALKAIFCVKGGYGTTRIIDGLHWQDFTQNPKWLVGFSDVTALHGQISRLGVESLHASMPAQWAKPGFEAAMASIKAHLFGQATGHAATPHVLNQTGRASGPLVGGNLSILAHMCGTSSMPHTQGAVLFIEDLDEYLYHIDRMMVQLKRAGILAKLAGLVVGQFSDMRDNNTPFGKTALQIIKEHTAPYGYPIGMGFAIGHEAQNMAVYHNRQATLTVGPEGATLRYT